MPVIAQVTKAMRGTVALGLQILYVLYVITLISIAVVGQWLCNTDDPVPVRPGLTRANDMHCLVRALRTVADAVEMAAAAKESNGNGGSKDNDRSTNNDKKSN